MRLQGERCLLRPWRSRDLGALVQHANNSNVSRYLRDRFPYPYTRKDGRGFLSMVTAGAGDDTKMAIEVDGEAIGGIGVIPGSDIERFSAELGYWLGRAWWGQGIMPRALGALVPWAFEKFELVRIEAGVFDRNAASARVLEKAGFHLEARLERSVIKEGQLLDRLLYVRVRD